MIHSVRVKVKFYLEQNEDYSLGDSISDSSEKLLQRGSGGRSIYMILVKGKFNSVKHLFYKKFSANYEELMFLWRELVLF